MTHNDEKSTDASSPSKYGAAVLYLAWIQARSVEVSAHWTRYNIQLLLNFGLLAVIVTRAKDPFVAAHLHFIAIIGIELTLIWFLSAIQAKRIINRWEERLRIYEDHFLPDDRLWQKIAAEDSLKSSFRRNWQNLNFFTWALPTLCLLGWFFLFATKKLD